MKRTTVLSFAAVAIAAAIAGCMGALTKPSRTASQDGRVLPDNCTKCHQAWAERFEYYRGWDRYGYIYGVEPVEGPYDPWYETGAANMFEKYYAAEWWVSPETYPWPDDVAANVRILSALSRPDGVPAIPASRDDISGPALVVAPEGGQYTSIQKAVNAARPGTTVFIRPGTYNECITLKDGVSLVGENVETTIINPLNKGHAIVAARNLLIASLTITGTGIDYATGAFNCAVYVPGRCDSTLVIAHNLFRENGLFGVWIDGAPDPGANRAQDRRLGPRAIEMVDRSYTNYPNPLIIGNTFYRIGQRGVFCVHARGEIVNNIFAGNVKALGLERHSRPLIHHNVCWFNNVPLAVNRSEPLVFNNIFQRNQWGQRMLRGANPVIFDNVADTSPFFRDFDESGIPIPFGLDSGTRDINPGFRDPLAGDFSFTASSPLRGESTGFTAMGVMRDPGLPQPPLVAAKNSYGRDVLALTPDIARLIETLAAEQAKIESLDAAYTVTYESFQTIKADRRGDPVSFTPATNPVYRVEYIVPSWRMNSASRSKNYSERVIRDGAVTADEGHITFNGTCLKAEGGRFAALYDGVTNARFIDERPFREAPGGFYRDYDQYVNAGAGPTGTFLVGYLRIMGGKIEEGVTAVDGVPCIKVRYPHIGKDQYFYYYLDPAIGYRPRRIEQYANEALFRVMDGYRYRAYDGINLPVALTVTDYDAVGPDAGAVTARWKLAVDEASVRVNH